MSDKNKTGNHQNNKERNERRRRRRLEKHVGIDEINLDKDWSVRGERALWRAVILQMLEDAARDSSKPVDLYNKEVARNWLQSGSQDFFMVCDLAGFDVEYLRKNIKKALLNNCKWREEAQPKKPAKKKIRKDKEPPKLKLPPKAVVLPLHDFHKKSA